MTESFGERCNCILQEQIHVHVQQQAPINPGNRYGNISINGYVETKYLCRSNSMGHPPGTTDPMPPVQGDFRSWILTVNMSAILGECDCRTSKGGVSCLCRKNITIFVPEGQDAGEANLFLPAFDNTGDPNSPDGWERFESIIHDILNHYCPEISGPSECCTLFDRREPPSSSFSVRGNTLPF